MLSNVERGMPHIASTDTWRPSLHFREILAKVEMKIMKTLRSHTFQAPENRVNACEQPLRGI